MAESAVDTIQEEDRKQILRAYRRLMRTCDHITDKSERKEIRRAFEYAMEAHEGARRKSGEPYILHPIAVAQIVVKEIGLGATSVVCALLHDVVEDTFAELSDIEREFGKDAARIIDGLTKISGVFDHKSSAQAENFRKMLLTLNDDVRVILIKLADRLHNMRTLGFMKKESQLKISSETLYLYAPLANRLGLNEIKMELEDAALKFTHPSIFQEISTKLKRIQRDSRYYIKSFISSIREKLKEDKLKFQILSRYKSIYSIYSKMLRQGIPFEEVYDLFAIRIILETRPGLEKSDCIHVFSKLTDIYRHNPDRLRDWLTVPKSNGYEALHVTLMGPKGRWVEVQIRTERMDLVAERGVAAHWKYKDGGGQHEEGFVKWLGRVRELLENPALNAIEVVKEFKTDLVTEEVFVFTPKGDLIQLPMHSTVLDFAYEIHTDVGDSCIGAKVNNKVVPLSYRLNNGDQVEIINSKKQSPKDEWLRFAETSKAKNRIRTSIRKQKRIIADKGKKIFEWKVRNYKMDDAQVTKELLAYFKLPTEQEFFYLLGLHRLDMDRLAEFIKLKEEGKPIPIQGNPKTRKRLENRQEFEHWLKENKGMASDQLMIGEDMDLSDYKFKDCCQPIPGDDILAIWDPNEGLVIHRPNCPQAITLMSNWGKNIVKANWTPLEAVSFLAGLKIIGQDQQGMMSNLIKVISVNMKLNIRSITIDSNDGMFDGIFKVFVRNTDELERLKERLRKVDGVMSVSRLEEV